MSKDNLKTFEQEININILTLTNILEVYINEVPKEVARKIQELLSFCYDTYLPLPKHNGDINVTDFNYIEKIKYYEC